MINLIPPEWADVESKAARLDEVRPELLQGAADNFRGTAQRIDEHTTELHAATTPLRDGAWKGETADNFYGHVDELGDAGKKLRDRLGSAADELTSLQDQLTGVRTSVTGRVHAARSEMDKVSSDAVAAANKALSQQDMVDRGVLGATAPAKTPEAILTEAAAKNAATAKAAGADVDDLLSQADGMINRSRELIGQKPGGEYSGVKPIAAPATVVRHRASATTTGAVRTVATSGGPPSTRPPGNVQEWIEEAIKELQAAGVNVTEADIPAIWAIIEHESGGDPNAINLWDSNAAAGHPSKGLMQCIDSTFQAHKLPGHDNIYNPVDNIIAGVQYSIDRYGSIDNVPGLQSMAHGGAYQGY